MKANHRYLCAGLLVVGSAACASNEEREETGLVSTELSGRLYAALRGEERAVRVFDLGPAEGGVPPSQACETLSDGDGRWRCDVGARFEAFRVEASTPEGHPLSAWVTGVGLGEHREGLALSPITHIAAAYAEYQVESGVRRDLAVERMQKDVYGHFGGLRHDRVDAFDVVQERPASLTEDVVAGVLLAGLERLTLTLGTARATPNVGVGSLTEALAADLRADGVFDGKGEGGRGIVLGGARLEAGLLREAYAEAIADWLEAERSRIGFGPDDLKGILDKIRTRSSAIFPPLEARVPEFERVVFSRNDAALPEGAPISGRVLVEVRLREGVQGAVEVLAELESSGQALQPLGGGRFAISTKLLSDGPHVLKLMAMSAEGAAQRLEVDFVVDNTPPELVLDEPLSVVGSTVTISGSWSDASGVRRLEVRADADVVVDDPPENFEVRVPFSCSGRAGMSVGVFDGAGNATHRYLSVPCDQAGPSIRWVPAVFVQEGTLTPTFALDGAIRGWERSAPPEELELGADTMWPVTLQKYRHRLGAGSENVPRLRWIIGEDEGAGVVVEYRYLIDDIERRGWTPLLPGRASGHDYVLPISYETLSPELADVAADQLNRVEVRARDAAGNVTSVEAVFQVDLLRIPAWIGRCAPDLRLRGFDLADRSMSSFYGASGAVLHASVRWPTDPAGEALEPGSVLVRFSGGEITSTVEEFIGVRHNSREDTTDARCQRGEHLVYGAGRTPGACVSGIVPNSTTIREPSTTVHTRRFELSREGTPILPNLGGAYSLESGVSYDLAIVVEQPRLVVLGQEIDWTLEPFRYGAYNVEVESAVLQGTFGWGRNFETLRSYDYEIQRFLGLIVIRGSRVVFGSSDPGTSNSAFYSAPSCAAGLDLHSSRASVRQYR